MAVLLPVFFEHALIYNLDKTIECPQQQCPEGLCRPQRLCFYDTTNVTLFLFLHADETTLRLNVTVQHLPAHLKIFTR